MMRLLVLGVVGVVACGPKPPSENDSDGSSGESMTGGPTSPSPSSDPTITSAGTETTGGVTTEVEPTTAPTTITGTGTTGDSCDSRGDCPMGQVCSAGTCTDVVVLPACPVVPVVTSIWPLVNTPTSLVAADLDGDADVDIAAGTPAVSTIELLFNSGLGEFVAGAPIGLIAATGSLNLAAADLDGDGHADLVAAQEVASDVNLLLGQGGQWSVSAVLDAPQGTRLVHVVDANGSGGADLLTLGEASPSVGVWLGEGLGAFKAEPPFDAPVSLGVEVIDVDGDGLADLVGPDHDDSFTTVRVLSRAPGGGFSDRATLTGMGEFIEQALAGQLDVQPGREIVALTKDDLGGLVMVWSAVVEGEWDALPRLVRTTSALTGGRLADFDGDGLVDLIAATDGPAITVLRGDGEGGFACEQTLEIESPTSHELLAVGDVDGDGRLEIVAGALDLPEIQVVTTL